MLLDTSAFCSRNVLVGKLIAAYMKVKGEGRISIGCFCGCTGCGRISVLGDVPG